MNHLILVPRNIIRANASKAKLLNKSWAGISRREQVALSVVPFFLFLEFDREKTTNSRTQWSAQIDQVSFWLATVWIRTWAPSECTFHTPSNMPVAYMQVKLDGQIWPQITGRARACMPACMSGSERHIVPRTPPSIPSLLCVPSHLGKSGSHLGSWPKWCRVPV